MYSRPKGFFFHRAVNLKLFFSSKPKLAFPQDPTLQKNIMNGHRFTFLLMNS